MKQNFLLSYSKELSKLTLKFQFDLMQDLPENHFQVSGASWVNIINYDEEWHLLLVAKLLKILIYPKFIQI